MPFFFKLYIAFLFIILILNIVFHTKFKVKPIFLIYEIFSALYMISLIFVYFSPALSVYVNFLSIAPFFIILAVDIYFTTFGSLKSIGIVIPEENGKSEEKAKIFSIILNSPAYIIGILTFTRLFF